MVNIDHGLWNQLALVQIPVLPVAHWASEGEVLNLPVPQFSLPGKCRK